MRWKCRISSWNAERVHASGPLVFLRQIIKKYYCNTISHYRVHVENHSFRVVVRSWEQLTRAPVCRVHIILYTARARTRIVVMRACKRQYNNDGPRPSIFIRLFLPRFAGALLRH